MGKMSDAFIYATPLALAVGAAWDTARRHYKLRESDAAAKAGLTAEYTAKLEARVRDLEKNQVELARRLDGSPKLSKFARG
jgi:hypothetical protein